jgi:SAM-dependent methyltransferase
MGNRRSEAAVPKSVHRSGRFRLILRRRAVALVLALSVVTVTAGALAQEAAKKPFEPVVGQSGKDVVWVPTPDVLVEKMLDMAKVTAQDFVMDLGSGDGRNIIAAAKRGANGLGIEWNQDMVDLSRRRAAEAGVADKARFEQGDMYAADISKANVLAMFLLTENLDKLMPKFLQLKPGTRIVINGFGITGWTPDVTERAEGDCGSWCTAHLFYVPAKVDGTWRLAEGELVLEQKFQTFTGALANGKNRTPIANGRLDGDRVSFTVGTTSYVGRVNGNTMTGDVKGSPAGTWTATKK